MRNAAVTGSPASALEFAARTESSQRRVRPGNAPTLTHMARQAVRVGAGALLSAPLDSALW